MKKKYNVLHLYLQIIFTILNIVYRKNALKK